MGCSASNQAKTANTSSPPPAQPTPQREPAGSNSPNVAVKTNQQETQPATVPTTTENKDPLPAGMDHNPTNIFRHGSFKRDWYFFSSLLGPFSRVQAVIF